MLTLALPLMLYFQTKEFYYRISPDHELIQVAKDGSFYWKVNMGGTGKLDWIKNIKQSYQTAPASQVEQILNKFL